MRVWVALATAVLVCGTFVPARVHPRPLALAPVASPDHRHLAAVGQEGYVMLNGKRVLAGAGRLVGSPVWRRDSQALAFLQRSESGMQLVVVLGEDSTQPLVWQLPPTVERLRRVFWMAPRRVGVGPSELVPRLVVSWTSGARTL